MRGGSPGTSKYCSASKPCPIFNKLSCLSVTFRQEQKRQKLSGYLCSTGHAAKPARIALKNLQTFLQLVRDANSCGEEKLVPGGQRLTVYSSSSSSPRCALWMASYFAES